ncbi:hypothetical protein CHARACLAT_030655 [Characodon lateralis]|uniref:Uncharacterized protein n=1 Tax=Characodon lateralis TaxID=208331 RepID=A0ABU7F7S7_9TELE|nr:hypothetical protein [Characodon lateralis]
MGASDSAETPRRPSPQTPPPAPPGGAQGVPRPAERHSNSSMSWAVHRASFQWDVPEEAILGAFSIDARATSTGSSQSGRAVALLRAPHPISISFTLRRKLISAACIQILFFRS